MADQWLTVNQYQTIFVTVVSDKTNHIVDTDKHPKPLLFEK